jgi:selenocysteine lyase/cysteine desulfurase
MSAPSDSRETRSVRIDALAARMRPHYSRFLDHRDSEILMTAHSHQAWPDVSRQAHVQAWDDAARWADHKWGHVFSEVIPEFQRRVVGRLGSTRSDDLTVGLNTHDLTARLLSCWPANARILTTDQEFHSLRRQLLRSMESGLQVDWVPAGDPSTVATELMARAERTRPDLVAVSQVFFTTGARLADLDRLLARLAELEVPVLVDTYHSFNVLQLDVDRWPGTVFVTGGGYKYAQSGEGACWMLCPADASRFRPQLTGWFADFDHLESPDTAVHYGPGGQRFMGATFDPTPFYRGAAVLGWMDEQGFTAEVLETAALDRTELLVDLYDRLELARTGLELVTPRARSARAGFVTLRRADAPELCAQLRQRGIRTDVRGPLLRFGPAPYTGSAEIERAMKSLSEVL